MGLTDYIIAELKCPVTGQISRRTISVKWARPPSQEEIQLGETLPFAKNMSDLWVLESYNCSQCEEEMDKQYPGWRTVNGNTTTYPASSDCPHGQPDMSEYYHSVFINIKNGKLVEIISEEEFKERGLKDFLDETDLCQW